MAHPSYGKLLPAKRSLTHAPMVTAKLREHGIEQRPLRAEELAGFNRAEVEKWAVPVKSSGAQVD